MLNHKSTPTKTGYSVVCNLFNKIVKKIQKMGHLDNKKCVWKAKEEVEALEKKMQQLEHELTQTQTNLDQATHNLEEKEKALQNVSVQKCVFFLSAAWQKKLFKCMDTNGYFVAKMIKDNNLISYFKSIYLILRIYFISLDEKTCND